MKKILAALVMFTCLFAQAQNPKLIKTVSNDVTEPNDKDQIYWQNNEWKGLFFYQGKGTPSKLCITDGTNAGTKYVADIGSGQLTFTLPAQDFIYLIVVNTISVSPAITETKLWKSDGTAAGTALVYTFPQITGFATSHNFKSNNRSQNFSVIGNTMIFGAFDPTNGVEIWKTDGTSTGLLKDIKSGVGNSSPQAFFKIGSDMFFTAMQTGFERKLWKTDGTTAGTVQVAVPEPFFISDYAVGSINNKMVFYATNTVDGYEPYVSDGTPGGTYMLKNINTTTNQSGNASLPSAQATEWNFNNKHCYFLAYNGTANALWRTDGTTAGTIQLSTDADNVSSANSNTTLTDIDSNNIWMLHHSTTGNSKLYKSNGTVAGTYLVKQGMNLPASMKLYKNACWFSGRYSGSFANVEVWRSGGNAATTNMAIDIAPGFPPGAPTLSYSSNPYGFFVKNNKLYFFATTSPPTTHNLYEYNGDFTFNGNISGGRWSDSANWNSAMPPGITDTVFVNTGTPNALNINGAKAYAGVLTMQSNAIINLASATDSLFVNTRLASNINNSFTGAGALVLGNANADTVAINNGIAASNLLIESNSNLVNGNISVNNALTLRNNGNLILNNNNLTLTGNTSTATASATSYVVTNGTGKMQIENIGIGARTGTVVFPIGTTSYNPVSFSNSGTADVFSARVINGISTTYIGETPGTLITAAAVNRTWMITEGTNGGSNTTISLQWNAADELPSFDRNATVLGHYTGGAWTVGGTSAASGANPYNYSRAGITSFSPFGILNSIATPVSNYWRNNSTRLNVFPNPVKENIQLRLTEQMQKETLTLQLFNTKGQMVMKQIIPQAHVSTISVNMSTLSHGVYYLHLKGKTVNASTIITITK